MGFQRTLAIVLLCLSPMAWSQDRLMAVTIDDVPAVATENSLKARRDVTLKLLTALNRFSVPAIGFVNEAKLYKDDELIEAEVDLLRLWLAAGMELGNHSFQHRDFHQTPLTQYQADVIRGEKVLKPLLAERDQVPRYYRHPYLRTGRDLDDKLAFEAFLVDHGYRVAPVTIDNSEWIFARAYQDALNEDDAELATRIGQDYVDYMTAILRYYEGQSETLFERPIAHSLLLHANQLNADWLDQLLSKYQTAGYRFATLDEVLEDPIYQSEDRYLGPAGITWMHRWSITVEMDPALYAGEPRVPKYILEMVGLGDSGY